MRCESDDSINPTEHVLRVPPCEVFRMNACDAKDDDKTNRSGEHD